MEELKKQYQNYKYSDLFIECAFKSLQFRKEKDIKGFIKSFFVINNIDNCEVSTIMRLSAHWNNVAYSKLQNECYQDYSFTMMNVINLRIIAKEMSLYDYNYNNFG